jgi:uncharacterized pyridoxal phosphate-dependent enzyme
MSPSTSTSASIAVPTFQGLGVRTLINCQGTYTIISGSRALKQVVEAMVAATDYYVNMDELMEKVGQRLAVITGAEWGYIAAGCAAALAEVTAACIAGADPEKMARLPDSSGMRNEVIVQKGQRNSYDRALALAGAKMVEVETWAELCAQVSERTAMLLIVGDLEQPGQIPSAQMIALGRERGIPVLVDAAAQRPDVPNRYLQLGADAVTYSGGKCLRGPQSAGLVLGRKALLQAAFLNSAPHHGVARPMKAGKEEVMGLLAAVEAWVMGRDHQAEWAMWEGFLETIRLAIIDLPSVRTEVQQPGISNVTPTLRILWEESTLHVSPDQVHQELLEGEPAIAMHCLAGGLVVNPYMMEAGEAELVGRRLRQLLSPRSSWPAQPLHPVPVDVGGDWLIETQYVLGKSTQAIRLVQEGDKLSGAYRTQFAHGPVQGRVTGQQVELRMVVGYQSIQTVYLYRGTIDGEIMQGSVALGEYGSATWNAKRSG